VSESDPTTAGGQDGDQVGDDQGPTEGPSTRPVLTITEAAQAAGVDRRTVRRRLDAGELPNAWREDGDEGPWRIPVEDLMAAGLRLHAPTPPSAPQDTARGSVPPPAPVRTPDELSQWRERALVAEAVAAERERTITGLELALRALGPGPTVPAVDDEAPPAMAAAPRPSWWRRLVGG
jgi:excisionase family DNA binding protein